MIPDNKYQELKPDIEKLSNPLFDSSEIFIRRRGSFLPHGAILLQNGEVKIVASASDESLSKKVSPNEVLPDLYEALRQSIQSNDAKAAAIAEDVTITLESSKPTKAIKVLFEHSQGFSIALYLPWNKKFLKGIEFGTVTAVESNPEINAW